MYCVVWRYNVDKSKQKDFENYYQRGGPWFKFFEPCDDYLGHDLLKNNEADSYLIIDKWMGQKEYESFLKSHQSEYDQLNRESSELYSEETQIGSYTIVN